MPATGLTALALAPPTPRVQVLQNFAPKAPVALWYFPAQGAPRQLLSADRAFITARNISQPGLLWASDGTFALLQPIADEPLITMNTGTPAPTLGICCPLSHPVLLPGALTLTGEGARQGFTVTLVHPNWKFAPFLDCCTLQLDAMPEGTYHVTADNPDATYEGTAVVGPSGGYVELAAQ